MLGNGHVPFLGGGMMVTSSCYPTAVTSGGTATSLSSCWRMPFWLASWSRTTARMLPSRSL